MTSDHEPRGLEQIYQAKPSSYFANARADMVALLETDRSSRILELGCGSGGTGRAALAAGKAGEYVGIELSANAAAVARSALTEVILGDVEQLDLSALEGRFDALVISEVLEHLTDPWATLKRLAACIKPGGAVLASSPNVAQWQVIRALIGGRFDYTEAGVMDRTHLRWFTPASYRSLFEEAGVRVDHIKPIREPGWKAKVINGLTGNRFDHLFMTQIMVVGQKS